MRKYSDGKYYTLPHVIELMQSQYDELFPVLNTQPEIEVLVNPFITAYQNDAMEQLEGQVACAKIGMARLASSQLYRVLSGYISEKVKTFPPFKLKKSAERLRK